MSKETEALRAGIRRGQIDCPVDPYLCNRMMAVHSAICPWQRAIERIYEVERDESP